MLVLFRRFLFFRNKKGELTSLHNIAILEIIFWKTQLGFYAEDSNLELHVYVVIKEVLTM